MKKLFCILALFVSTGCVVHPTSYHGYNPNPVVVYPSHHNYWHGYNHHHHHMRHW
jgi:hypothetical protein